jgi:transposase
LVLVALSVVEQRLDAVRLVLADATVTEVAARVGVSRHTLHWWLGRYLAEGVAGLGSTLASAAKNAFSRSNKVIAPLVPRTWSDSGWMYTAGQLDYALSIGADVVNENSLPHQ